MKWLQINLYLEPTTEVVGFDFEICNTSHLISSSYD